MNGVERLVLVVDDDPSLRRLIALTFETAGYGVRTAADGVECLEALTERRPDLVVLDILMPRMDGMRVLGEIRSNFELGNLPVIILSAKAAPTDEAFGRLAGASDYLTKPFEPAELLERASRLLHTVAAR